MRLRVETEGGLNQALGLYEGTVRLVAEGRFEKEESYGHWREDTRAMMQNLSEVDMYEVDNLEETHEIALEALAAANDKEVARIVKELESKDKEFQKEREILTKRIRKLEGQLSTKKTKGDE